MSKTREESAIDTIYNLVQAIESLDKKVMVIDSNIKLLNNKVSKLTKSINEVKNQSFVDTPRNVISSDGLEYEEDTSGVQKLVLGNINTYGYVVGADMKPLENVNVQVFDSSNELIKDMRTNRDGHWTVRLKDGKYSVKYIMDGFKDIKRTIELTKQMTKYEVK